tara:strand:+ start:516 stop:719 length:204 start_codon:yes stop_codon:yes gene_type:complete
MITSTYCGANAVGAVAALVPVGVCVCVCAPPESIDPEIVCVCPPPLPDEAVVLVIEDPLSSPDPIPE